MLDKCDFMKCVGKYTVAPLSLLFGDSQHGETAMVELKQLLPFHSTHIFNKHKGLSVSLISITKSPWSVLQACSPRSCASLDTQTPPHSTPPSPPPPAAHDELPKGFGAPIVYIASVSVVHSMPKPPDRGLFLWAQWHLAPMPGCLLPGGAVSLLLLVPY